MMGKIKNFFSNVVTLALLLVLGIGVVLFLSSHSQNGELTAQTTRPTPTPVVEETPPTPTIALTPTIQSDQPEDDRPEPTSTPVIVLPDATSPPDPTPVPTPTSTPINPNESEIAAFDVPVGGLAISPDDQTLAVVAALKFLPEQGGNIVTQLWIIDLSSNKVEKLDVYGRHPIWSPDGQHILFEARSDNQVEIKVVNKDGKDEKTLTSLPWGDLLGYYWFTSEQITVIKPDSVDKLDLTGNSVDKINITLPAKSKYADVKPEVIGHPNGFVVVADGQNLLIINYNGQITTIADTQGRQISGPFGLSSDGKQLAYVVDDGSTNDELWFTDLVGSNPSQLYRVERGHIVSLTWTPDNQAILIGWKKTGTTLGDELTLLMLDVKNDQAISLQVDNVDRGFVFSHNGDRLFYGRAFYVDPTSEAQTTLYQLKVKR
jgi:dipeptidyl aminopeptidase/acylaminoacyl peptidase